MPKRRQLLCQPASSLTILFRDLLKEHKRKNEQSEKKKRSRSRYRVMNTRYTDRSIKIVEEISRQTNIPVAAILRVTIDRVFSGDIRKELLDGTEYPEYFGKFVR